MVEKTIIKKASIELNLSYSLVWGVYQAYWFFIRKHIESLPLKEDISEEEFSKLKTNINIPSIGKMSCTFNRMMGVKKRREHETNNSN